MCGVALAQTKSAKKPAKRAAANLMNPSSLRATAPATYRVDFKTTKGDVIIDVTRAWAPHGADRFYNLVRAGFFTDCAFFRVVRTPRPFMAQFGINSNPAIAKAWDRANIPDDPRGQSNTRGMLTFATTGQPNTRGTQLFINYGDNSFLDSQGFVPFGQVVQGMELVDQFYDGYGDTAEKEGEIENGGKAYIDRNMPKLDRILTARVVPAAAAPAAK